jgi:hypothetical protein
MTPKYRVRYTEYERGWGSRPDGFRDFDTHVEAKAAADAFNAQNTAETAPDWYMVASEPVFVDADVTKN